MTNTHNYSFFGQKVGLIIQSSSKNEPYIFFRLIKSKENGIWEKPSNGEGKVIKFSIEEMVWIIRVLKKEAKSWSSFHTYKDNKTQITFKWEENENGKLWIHIGSYSKILSYSQFKVLEMLLKHILKEKIKFSTINQSFNKHDSAISNTPIMQEKIISRNVDMPNRKNHINKINIKSDRSENNEKKKRINGVIKGETEKALLIQFDSNSEIWIPKSTIHSNFNIEKNITQDFTIDTWILQKNKVLS